MIEARVSIESLLPLDRTLVANNVQHDNLPFHTCYLYILDEFDKVMEKIYRSHVEIYLAFVIS